MKAHSNRFRSCSQLVSSRVKPKKLTLPKCYNELCYYQTPSNKNPPFDLLLDKKMFISRQMPGIEIRETGFVEALEYNTVSTSIMIDFIGYERQFIKKIRLLIHILEQLENTYYSSMYFGLNESLSAICREHMAFSAKIENIVKKHTSLFLIDFIETVTSCKSLLNCHQNYCVNYLKYESLAISMSEEFSGDLMKNLNEPVIGYFKAPMAWHEYIANAAKDLENSLPRCSNPQLRIALIDFAKSNEDLSVSVDSIPKLEQISRCFLIEPFPIVVPGRRFIRKGKALKQCRKALSERDILLFSDIFVYVQVKGGKYVVPGVYELLRLRVEAEDKLNSYSILFFAPMKSFILYFEQREERDIWLEEIEEAIANKKLTQPNVKYREAPIWKPDSETNNCSGCGCQLSFFVRKHHCRGCGGIFCSDCLSNKIIIKNISQKPCKVCAACFARFEQDKSKYVSIFHTGNEEEEEGTEEESTKLFNFLSIDTIPPSCQLLPQISDSSDSESNNDEKDRQICFDDTKFKDTHQIPMQKTKRSCSLPNN